MLSREPGHGGVPYAVPDAARAISDRSATKAPTRRNTRRCNYRQPRFRMVCMISPPQRPCLRYSNNVITAEQAQAYKPSRQLFQYACRTMGVTKSRRVHVAIGMYWDMKARHERRLLGNRVNRQGKTFNPEWFPLRGGVEPDPSRHPALVRPTLICAAPSFDEDHEQPVTAGAKLQSWLEPKPDGKQS